MNGTRRLFVVPRCTPLLHTPRQGSYALNLLWTQELGVQWNRPLPLCGVSQHVTQVGSELEFWVGALGTASVVLGCVAKRGQCPEVLNTHPARRGQCPHRNRGLAQPRE
jgi:hypothetical protein